MQQNAQAALPVIPNNGNPNGAYNMPPQGAPMQTLPTQPQDKYSWLKPSQSMDNIREFLASRRAQLAQPAAPVPQLGGIPMPKNPAPLVPQPGPVMPQRVNTQVEMPVRTPEGTWTQVR